jgi:chloramphenicol 3-O phosphotransferase
MSEDISETTGRIVILNGAPRSGKSSIVTAIQNEFHGAWINLGVDASVRHMIPERYRPGIGLRPGGERPDLEELICKLYAAIYLSIAEHSRMGLNVVAEFGHHDSYSRPLGILGECARRLARLPVLFVGVRCPIDTIMQRRLAEGDERRGEYLAITGDGEVPAPVLLWQQQVHLPGVYDLEVDTSAMSPGECATAIRRALQDRLVRPTAFERLASHEKSGCQSTRP